MTFEHPQLWLALIPIGLILWLVAKRSNAPLASDQIRQSLAVRCIGVAFIVAAIAGPMLRGPSRAQCVVFLVDVSRSISPSARAAEFGLVRKAIATKPRDDRASVIEFASATSVLVPPTTTPNPPDDHVGVDDESTDIGGAIQTAAAVIGHSGAGQIVLITDGNETNGDAIQAANDAGLPIDSIEPAAFLGQLPPETSVAHVDIPSSVHRGEPFRVRAVIDSTSSQTARLTLKVAGQAISAKSVHLTPGHNLVSFPITVSGSGLRQVEVDVAAPNDTMVENNSAVAMTQVIGEPRVLYITDSPSRISATLQQAIDLQHIGLVLKPAIDAPTNAAGFAAYDGVVISNTPSSELSSDQQNALVSAVRDFGVGLGMVGGINSYIGGGWAQTPVEEALPVEMEPRAGEKMPAADVVIVLDASGSMAMQEDGVEKVQLAARAAVSLLGAMQPNDRVAVIAVTTAPKLVLPFSKPKDALAAKSEIEGVQAGGGGIYCLTGLEAAYDQLESSKASIKHVVICPDTSDSEQQENCVELARTMRVTDHVTTSVCGIGSWSDSDVGFQSSVAAAGGGQLFVVSQASDLPQFFQRDLGHFQAPPYIEKAFKPTMGSPDKVLVGLNMASAPDLLGYNVVTARPGATVAMRAPGEPDPIFAYRTYGIGRTFAFTSDETDHWAKRWISWPDYSQFWTQVLRWSLRSMKPADFQAFADMNSGSGAGHVVVDAFSGNGGFVNGASFGALMAAPDGRTARIMLDQTAPGRYEAQFPMNESGAYVLTVSRNAAPDDGVALLGLAQSYPAEYVQSGPNIALLRRISGATGGRTLSDAASAWKIRPAELDSKMTLAPLLLLVGMVFFILDIAWRRLGLRVRARRLGAGAGIVTTAAKMSNANQVIPPVLGRARVMNRREAKNDDDAYLARPVGGIIGGEDSGADDEDEFPLVASLDELRRRASAARDSQRRPP